MWTFLKTLHGVSGIFKWTDKNGKKITNVSLSVTFPLHGVTLFFFRRSGKMFKLVLSEYDIISRRFEVCMFIRCINNFDDLWSLNFANQTYNRLAHFKPILLNEMSFSI